MQTKLNLAPATRTPHHLTEISISALEARRVADKYLTLHVGIAFSATEPVFVPLEQPVWQFTIRFRLPRLGTLAMMGTIDVAAETRKVCVLSKKRIQEIQKRANAIVEYSTSTPAARI